MAGRQGHVFANWASTYACLPELYFEPRDLHQLKQVLNDARIARKEVKVIGCGHSPSNLACTSDYMVSLKYFNKLLEVDHSGKTFRAEGGIKLTKLNVELGSQGMALSVLGSVSDISLAGAISTGTHGTGINYGCLAAQVLELELLKADGEVVTLTPDKDGDLFKAVALGLGALGIVLSVKVRCEKAFNLQHNKYGAKLQDVLENLDVHVKASDHMRFNWYPHTDKCVVYHSCRTNRDVKRTKSFFWETVVGYWLLEFLLWISTWFQYILPKLSALYCYLESSHAEYVDVSHKVFNFNCLFKQYVMEWAIPIDKTGVALYELKQWVDTSGFRAHFPVEVRFVQGDDLLLSPAHGRDSCYINIIMYRPYNKLVDHAAYWQAFKQIMLKYGGRPHWAKDHLMTSQEFCKIYPKWDTFCKLRQQMDPQGMFLNDNLRKSLTIY